MVIQVRHGDITKNDFDCDVIVNAANPRLLGGGGVDGCIHRGAGPELRKFCGALPEVEPDVRCRVGETILTPAFMLPFKGIIHTVGPMFHGARPVCFPGEAIAENPNMELIKCIKNCLDKTQAEGFRSVALPAISCGVYGCDIPTFVMCLIAMCMRSGRGVTGWDDWPGLDHATIVIYEEVDFAMFNATVKRIRDTACVNLAKGFKNAGRLIDLCGQLDPM